MKIYLISLAAGLLVGVIYGFMGVRSPAPPIVALIGLLGILVGEQVVPIGKRLLSSSANQSVTLRETCTQHLFGSLPGHGLRPSLPAPETKQIT
jgi:XapX domain-containing protein